MTSATRDATPCACPRHTPRRFAGLLPGDVDLQADRVRCPGCGDWSPVLYVTPDRRLRCWPCLPRRVLAPLEVRAAARESVR